MNELRKFDEVSPEARNFFLSNGFLCIRNFLSPDQIQSLRQVYADTRLFRKSYRNTAVQRFQPMSRFRQFDACRDHIDFERVAALATAMIGVRALVVDELLGAWTSNSRLTYVLPWHRDIRDNSTGFDYSLWEGKQGNREYFLQFNLPIFDDASFWAVPGSDSRPDTPIESAGFNTKPVTVPGQEAFLNPWLPKSRLYTNSYRLREHLMNRLDHGNAYNVARNEQRLARCQEYARCMPGAIEVSLGAGDIFFYRGCSWHTAIYRADVDRFTFFSNVRTEQSDNWYRTIFLPSRA